MKFNKMNINITYQIFEKAVRANVTINPVQTRTELATIAMANLTDTKVPVLKTNFTATAVLKDGDEPNIEAAKRIARKKAMRAVYGELITYNEALYRSLNDSFVQYGNYIKKLKRTKSHINDEIIKIAHS